MPFSDSVFDPTMLTLMYRVLDAAWVELVQRGQCKNPGEIRPLMTKRIMAEVALGETNPERLKILALSAVNVGAITAEPFVVGRFATGSRFPNVPLGLRLTGQGTLLADALIKRGNAEPEGRPLRAAHEMSATQRTLSWPVSRVAAVVVSKIAAPRQQDRRL